MGLLKDYNSIKKQTKEIGKNHDVKSSLADMTAKTAALNASMAAVATSRAATEGVPATATILAAQPTGAMINFAPVTQLDLLVMLPGRPPISVRHDAVVPPMYVSTSLPGQSIVVRALAADPHDICIDWASA